MINMNNLILVAMLAALLLVYTDAYTSTQQQKQAYSSVTTRLNAWSLPEPPAGFGSFKSSPTWYNVVDNPTARRTVYEDSPNEFRFVALGSDWPSVSEWGNETSSESNDLRSKPRLRINPLRRAAKFLAARRRN